MDQFMIRFLLCNLLLSGIIGVLLLGKRLLKNSLSSRMQYNLWFLLLGLLAVPFVPPPLSRLSYCENFMKTSLDLHLKTSRQSRILSVYAPAKTAHSAEKPAPAKKTAKTFWVGL